MKNKVYPCTPQFYYIKVRSELYGYVFVMYFERATRLSCLQTAQRQTGLFKNRPRSGRPRVTTRAQDRYINNIVARNRFATALELTAVFMLLEVRELGKISIQTLRNCIPAGGFKFSVPQKKPELSQCVLTSVGPMQGGTTLNGGE